MTYKFLTHILAFSIGLVTTVVLVFFVFETTTLKILLNNPQNIEKINRENTPISNVTQMQNFKTKYVSGKIISFNNVKMIIRVTTLDGRESVVNVSLTEGTKYTKMVPKDFELFQRELQEFQNTPTNSERESPQPFVEEVANLQDFTVGKLVVVKTTENVTDDTKNVIAESVGLPQ